MILAFATPAFVAGARRRPCPARTSSCNRLAESRAHFGSEQSTQMSFSRSCRWDTKRLFARIMRSSVAIARASGYSGYSTFSCSFAQTTGYGRAVSRDYSSTTSRDEL